MKNYEMTNETKTNTALMLMVWLKSAIPMEIKSERLNIDKNKLKY